MAMTAPSGTMSASMDVPHSQNTAPVLEFRCLYTADIRRKQKRWQDGRLMFHTFNKRVMVYDEKGNFVGDTHWKGGLDFEEGEELELELDRGGNLVEVGECIGKRDQDLSELVDKRVKERKERAAAKVALAPPSASFLRAPGTPGASALLRPKPLNAMLTPTGHYGRAQIPNTSPFEERQAAIRNGNEPPAKRRRQNDTSFSKNGYAQNLMGATLSLSSSKPSRTPTIRYEPFKARPIQQSPSEAIDLTMDDEEERRASDARRKIAKDLRAAIERPAPREKRSRKSPPVKSGYASNLTGTQLILSRSEPRPPAQTVIPKAQVRQRSSEIESSALETEDRSMEPAHKRPSHLKMKPAAIQPGNKDIDQSSEEEDTSIDAEPPRKVAVQPVRTSEMSRIQARNQVNQGASIEGEDNLVHVEIRLPTEEVKRQNNLVTYHRHSGHDAPSAPEIEYPLKRPTKMHEIQKKVLARNPMNVPKSKQRSPPQTNNPTLVLQRGGSVKTSALQKYSALEPTPDRPMSALRIKSRPGRKMMMLMSYPSSRPAASNTYFNGSRPTAEPLQKPATASNESVLSQATIKLNAFCEKQQAELEARLTSIGSKPHPRDLSSLGPENGIDHQTVDLLWTRKAQTGQTNPVQPIAQSPNLIEKPKSPNRQAGMPVGEKPTSCDQISSFTGIEGYRQLKARTTSVEYQHDGSNARTSRTIPPVAKVPDPKIDRPTPVDEAMFRTNEPGEEPAIMALRVSTEQSQKHAGEATSLDKDLEKILQRSQEVESPLADVERQPPEIGETAEIAALKESPEEDAIATDRELLKRLSGRNDVLSNGQSSAPGHESPVGDPGPNGDNRKYLTPVDLPGQAKEQVTVSRAHQSKLDEVLEHFTGSVQSSTARFRAMIHPSSCSRKSPPVTASLPVESAISHSSNASKGKPVTIEGAVRPGAKSFSAVKEALHDRPEPCSGFSSTSTPDLAAGNSRLGPPRAPLANPATRGKSLQTLAASTVNTMNPLFNPMPPPGPRIPTRVNLVRVDSDVDRVSEGLRDAPASGPWSREAFDLFGLHGPPRVETGPGIPAA